MKKDRKRPKSLSIRESNLKRWEEAAAELGIDLNSYMERAGNELAEQTLAGKTLDLAQQVHDQSERVDQMQKELKNLRRDLRAQTKIIDEALNLEPTT